MPASIVPNRYLDGRTTPGKKIANIIREIEERIPNPSHLQQLTIDTVRAHLVSLYATLEQLEACSDPKEMTKLKIEVHTSAIGKYLNILLKLGINKSDKHKGHATASLYEKAMRELGVTDDSGKSVD